MGVISGRFGNTARDQKDKRVYLTPPVDLIVDGLYTLAWGDQWLTGFRYTRVRPKSWEMWHLETGVRAYPSFSAFAGLSGDGMISEPILGMRADWFAGEKLLEAIDKARQRIAMTKTKWEALQQPKEETRMGMSTHVVGFAPPDEDWKRMRAVWDACKAAKVEVPSVVEEFFNGYEPTDRGVEIALGEGDGVTEYRADCRDGFDVDLSKLPKEVKILRVFNSY